MGILLAALAVEAARGTTPAWVMVSSAVLAGGPVVLAWFHTVPSAVRLGRGADEPAVQARLARAIYRDHRICFASMAAFLALWLLTGLS
jgi:hypothetical protein